MKNVRSVVLTSILATILAGCSLSPRQSVATCQGDALPGVAVVESGPTSVVISQADIFVNEGEMVISGRLKRMHEVPMPGHVDLSICAADGTLLDQQTVRVAGLAAKRKGAMEVPFRFRVNSATPGGAKIRLRYHTAASVEPCLSCKS